jgi:putative ABC transport system substrate-binding protein
MGLKPDLMVSSSNLVTATLQAEVQTVPLLFIGLADPIGSGFVTSFARPTGNITGFSNFDTSMGSKWLETLKEIAPRVEHVGFMLQPETPANVGMLKAAEAASLKAKVTPLEVHNADEIERAVGAFAREPNRGLIIAPHAVTRVNGKLIVELAARHELPAVYAFASFAQAGGLISYGIDLVDQFRQGAGYADRILKGAKPAELPVQSPTKFELVINLKTAKALGLEVSPSLLARADEVIE